MNEHIYADEVGAISVTGAIVRFDLMIQSATEKDADGKPQLVHGQQVIMPIDSFLRSVTRMQNAVQDMLKKGVITRAPKEHGQAETAAKK
jgi:hypothetical protein